MEYEDVKFNIGKRQQKGKSRDNNESLFITKILMYRSVAILHIFIKRYSITI